MQRTTKIALMVIGGLIVACFAMERLHSRQHIETLPPIRVFNTGAFACYFSPDSKWLVTTNDYKLARIWDITTGKLLNSLGTGKNSVDKVAFSADSHLLALGSNDHRVVIWDTRTWRQAQTWPNICPNEHFSLEFSKDGNTLITSSVKALRYWSLHTGRLIRTQPNPIPDSVRSTLSPDRTLLAIRGRTGYVSVKNVKSGAQFILKIGTKSYQVRSFPWGKPWSRPNRVSHIEFSKDSTLLAAGCNEQIVKLWRMPGGQEIATFAGEALAIAPDARTISTGDNNGIITLWDTKTGRQYFAFQTSENTAQSHLPSSLIFSPDGNYLAAVMDDGVKLWKIAQLHPTKEGQL